MLEIFNILGQVDFIVNLSLVDIVRLWVGLAGLFLLANWFVSFSGPRSLRNSPIRRNSLALYVPFLQILAWLILAGASMGIIDYFLDESLGWQKEFFIYSAVGIVEMVLIIVYGYIGRHMFARRLKGLGLNLRTIFSDFFSAAVNFVTVFPLVLLSIWLVIFFGRLIAGPDFGLDESEGLTVIIDNPQLVLRVLVIFFVAVVAPVFEELLFRGMVQSALRGVLFEPWLAIAASSAIFAVMHPPTHWLPLFVLAGCMGYTYEKSGSLFRPIFIHIFFNAANVTAALLA